MLSPHYSRMDALVMSNAPPTLHLTWRPSRYVVAALALLGCAGAFASFASDLPLTIGMPLAIASFGWGLASSLREHRRPRRVFKRSADGTMTLDTMQIQCAHLLWRGSLAYLSVRDADGRTHRLSFWPDTLGPRARRALRLALDVPEPTRRRAASRRSRHEMRR